MLLHYVSKSGFTEVYFNDALFPWWRGKTGKESISWKELCLFFNKWCQEGILSLFLITPVPM